MTPRDLERARAVRMAWHQSYQGYATLEKLIAAAIADEREQCAKVCIDIAPHPSGEEIIMSTSRWIVTSCASAIRARGGA